MNPRTCFLARLLGLFLILASVAMLANQTAMIAAVAALVQDKAATLVLALLCLGGGLAMVLLHQVWSGGLTPVLVTVLGWVLLARGILLLFLPATLLTVLAAAVATPLWFDLAGVIALGIGLFLTYAGFRAPPILAARQ